MKSILLQVQRHRLEGIAEEMGNVLQRTAFSTNIKERRDFSCALADASGRLVAQAAHIPVHLGSLSETLRGFLDAVDPERDRGYLMNDPYRGGTHLPDLSYLEAWSVDDVILGYVVCRAHHSDVGGHEPGSMAVSTHIDEEGFRTGPLAITREGRLDHASIRDLLDASRSPRERITDLQAQVAAVRRGVRRLNEWYGDLNDDPGTVFAGLQDYSRRFTRSMIGDFSDGTYTAEEWMDDDGTDVTPVRLHVRAAVDGERLTFDYGESDPQVRGNLNCPRSVVVSASYYVIRGLLEQNIPVNQGIFEPVDIRTRPGTVLDVEPPGAVAAGNVETSQRIVDLLLKALHPIVPETVPAASQGTMNNVTFGYENEAGDGRTYYETLGGGAGGGPDHPGLSGRQVHMTNTQNTPIEEFERRFPLCVEELRLRRGSGGDGRHEGGEGLVKTWQALARVRASVVSERRRYRAYGLEGGRSGRPGQNVQYTNRGRTILPGKARLTLSSGDRLSVKTPGGGGWGTKDE